MYGMMYLSATSNGMTQMLSDVGTVLTSVIDWFGSMVDALVNSDGALNPLFPLLALGIAVTICFTGVKIVRSFIWGA